MNPNDLPADFATWSDARKKSVLLALLKGLVPEHKVATSLPTVLDLGESCYYFGPFKPSRPIDANDPRMPELRRLHVAKHEHLPLDTALDRLTE